MKVDMRSIHEIRAEKSVDKTVLTPKDEPATEIAIPSELEQRLLALQSVVERLQSDNTNTDQEIERLKQEMADQEAVILEMARAEDQQLLQRQQQASDRMAKMMALLASLKTSP